MNKHYVNTLFTEINIFKRHKTASKTRRNNAKNGFYKSQDMNT